MPTFIENDDTRDVPVRLPLHDRDLEPAPAHWLRVDEWTEVHHLPGLLLELVPGCLRERRVDGSDDFAGLPRG